MCIRAWWRKLFDRIVGNRRVSPRVGIGCIDNDERTLSRQLRRMVELTPSNGAALPSSPAIELLLGRAVAPDTLSPDGRYTSPRSFGVYELRDGVTGMPRFAFGNHPVRQRELASEHRDVRLIATFLDRDSAESLVQLLGA